MSNQANNSNSATPVPALSDHGKWRVDRFDWPRASDLYDEFALHISPRPELVEAAAEEVFQRICRRWKAAESQLFEIKVVLLEALTNAMEHGCLEIGSERKIALLADSCDSYHQFLEDRICQSPFADRAIAVKARLSNREVRLTVADDGLGFRREPTRVNPEQQLSWSGRGLMLIETFMDQVSFNASGNRITMLKSRPRGLRQQGRVAQ